MDRRGKKGVGTMSTRKRESNWSNEVRKRGKSQYVEGRRGVKIRASEESKWKKGVRKIMEVDIKKREREGHMMWKMEGDIGLEREGRKKEPRKGLRKEYEKGIKKIEIEGQRERKMAEKYIRDGGK